MRVLNLADATFQDKTGGSRKYAQDLALQMHADGLDVDFLVLQQRPELPLEENWNGIQIHRYPGRGMLERQKNLRDWFVKIQQKTPFDLVLVHFAYTALAYHRLPISQEIPTIRFFQGPWDAEYLADKGGRGGAKTRLAARTMYEIERYSLQRSHCIITLSEFMTTDAIERFGISRSKINIIPPGVDLQQFTPGDKAAARNRFGIPQDAFVVCSTRRLQRRMGLDLLIEAAAIARHSIPGLKVRIAGKGALQNELQQQIDGLKLQDCVQLAGFVPDDLLAEHYRASDLFVLPTVALEGFGLVILEAMACNTPVMGTPVGSIPSVLGAFDKNLLFREASAAAIAEGMVEFANRPEKQNISFRSKLEQNYTWKLAAEKILALSSQIGRGISSAA